MTIFSLRTSESQSEEYTSVVYEQYHWPTQEQSSPLSSQVNLYSPEMGTGVSPTLFYPLYLRLTSRGKTQIPAKQYEEKPQRLPSSDRVDDSVEEADKRRVPSHVVPLVVSMNEKQHQQSHRSNATNFSGIETHGEQINASNTTDGSGEQSDNAIGVEHLPTIAVPFLDTLTHGIIEGIQQHVQLIKPGKDNYTTGSWKILA